MGRPLAEGVRAREMMRQNGESCHYKLVEIWVSTLLLALIFRIKGSDFCMKTRD
jgi:hypothetical protein